MESDFVYGSYGAEKRDEEERGDDEPPAFSRLGHLKKLDSGKSIGMIMIMMMMRYKGLFEVNIVVLSLVDGL